METKRKVLVVNTNNIDDIVNLQKYLDLGWEVERADCGHVSNGSRSDVSRGQIVYILSTVVK